MILRNSKNILKALAVCTGFFSLAACKEHSILKEGLDEVDNINTFAKNTSDFDIAFELGRTDSLLTSYFTYSKTSVTTSPDAIAIGAYNDPFFGQTQAIAHFQMTPYNSSFKFPDEAVIDSAVLVLPFTYTASSNTATGGFYGDTLSTLHWNIYETGEYLDRSKQYYSNHNTSLGNLIGSASFNYQQFKSGSEQIIAATSDTTESQLRIRLNSSFASEMFNADTANYINTTAFQAFFKGLSIVPDLTNPQNALTYFLLPNVATGQKSLEAARIEFHYHVGDEKNFSSVIVRPNVCAYYSNIVQNFASYPANNYINKKADTILIQSQPGFYTDVKIKGLQGIPLSVINKAELIITAQVPGTNLKYLTAPDLIVPVLVKDGKEEILLERLDNSGAVNSAGVYMIDPYLKTATINGVEYGQYRLNIPRTIQQAVLNGDDEITIRLKGSNYYPGMDRILAKGIGGGSDGTNFQFNIIYSKR